MNLRKTSLLLFIGCLLTFVGCADDSPKSSEKQIIEFSINGTKAAINEATHTIELNLPYGTDNSDLTPTIKISDRATINPASGKSIDFSSPITFLVTAEDGSKQPYEVTVTVAKNSEAQILSFELANLTPKITATIDEDKKTITTAVPFATDLRTLIPTIAFKGGTISPETNKETDFTSPVIYKVTAEDGTVKEYTVTIIETKSSEAQLLTFEFTGLSPKIVAKVNETTKTVYAEVPFGTNVTNLVPTITFKGNVISPASGKATNFSSSVTYTVTSEDKTAIKYTATVKTIASSEAELTEFAFDDLYPRCVGTLNKNTNIVTIDVPFGTDITKLKPTIKFKGNTISPESGVVQDFSKTQVFYTIKAQDGKKNEFSVIVNISLFQPEIKKINRTKFTNGDEIIVEGKFSETGNEIVLRNSTNAPVYPTITRQTSTYIVATIPSLAGAGEYNMTVRSYLNTPYQGSVLYEASKITIVDPKTLNPKILSITPKSIIKGTQYNVYFKSENITDLGEKYANIHYVKGSVDNTTNGLRPEGNDVNDFFIEVGRNWSVGTYTFYLERNGYKSNEVTFELKANPYPVPTITSVSTYTPMEGETITVKGTNFSKVSNYDTYIDIRKVSNSMGYSYPGGTAKVTVIDNNTLTFSLPYIAASNQFPEEIGGLVGIEIIANGQSVYHYDQFTVKKK